MTQQQVDKLKATAVYRYGESLTAAMALSKKGPNPDQPAKDKAAKANSAWQAAHDKWEQANLNLAEELNLKKAKAQNQKK
jgi:hypothetical protein